MKTSTSHVVLSRMFEQQRLSLVGFVIGAGAYTSPESAGLAECHHAIATRRLAMASRIANLIHARRGMLPTTTFPASYTSLHDLDLRYLIDRIRDPQATLVADTTSFVAALDRDVVGKGLANEVLTQEREHLLWLTEASATAWESNGSAESPSSANPSSTVLETARGAQRPQSQTELGLSVAS